MESPARRRGGVPTRGRNKARFAQNGSRDGAEKMARGLGWFSIALGLAEVLAPRGVARIAGVSSNTRLIRLFGLREIASGVGIFAQSADGRKPAAGVWARVAGDALDLTALGAAFGSPRSDKNRLAFATANVAAVTALDVLCARRLSAANRGSTAQGSDQMRNSQIIGRSPDELYRYWRNLENLPSFMRHLASVQVTGATRSHWVAKAPAGTTIAWDAEITEDRPGRMIAWRSLEGSALENSGSVHFDEAPGGRGTIVRVVMTYNPPGGVIGEWVAKITGDDHEQQAQEALRCFKQVMEAGEVAVSDGTIWDNGYLTQRPAQPPSRDELQRLRPIA